MEATGRVELHFPKCFPSTEILLQKVKIAAQILNSIKGWRRHFLSKYLPSKDRKKVTKKIF